MIDETQLADLIGKSVFITLPIRGNINFSYTGTLTFIGEFYHFVTTLGQPAIIFKSSDVKTIRTMGNGSVIPVIAFND